MKKRKKTCFSAALLSADTQSGLVVFLIDADRPPLTSAADDGSSAPSTVINALVLFRAFDVNKRSLLTFPDVLYGLACLEPCTQHGGAPAEMRCRYIFRYYDVNSDSLLQFDEFK